MKKFFKQDPASNSEQQEDHSAPEADSEGAAIADRPPINLSTIMHMALINGVVAQALSRTRAMTPDMCKAKLANLTPAVYVVGTAPHPSELGEQDFGAFVDGVKQRWNVPESVVAEFAEALLHAGAAMAHLAAVMDEYRI
jgi:hypothetical protein